MNKEKLECKTVSSCRLEIEMKEMQNRGARIKHIYAAEDVGPHRSFHVIHYPPKKPTYEERFEVISNFDPAFMNRHLSPDTADALSYMYSGLRAGKTNKIIHDLRELINRQREKLESQNRSINIQANEIQMLEKKIEEKTEIIKSLGRKLINL